MSCPQIYLINLPLNSSNSLWPLNGLHEVGHVDIHRSKWCPWWQTTLKTKSADSWSVELMREDFALQPVALTEMKIIELWVWRHVKNKFHTLIRPNYILRCSTTHHSPFNLNQCYKHKTWCIPCHHIFACFTCHSKK